MAWDHVPGCGQLTSLVQLLCLSVTITIDCLKALLPGLQSSVSELYFSSSEVQGSCKFLILSLYYSLKSGCVKQKKKKVFGTLLHVGVINQQIKTEKYSSE